MLDRVLILSLGGCAIFGALLFVELTSTPNDEQADNRPPAPAEAAPATPVQRPQIDQLMATSLGRPLFSATRQPPEEAAAASRPVAHELPNLRLTGIIIEPDRHLAIFAVPGAKPLVRSEGEMVDGMKLDSIGPHQVSLSGPTGVTTLEPKTDPHLVRPPPPAFTGPAPGQPGTAGHPPSPVVFGHPPPSLQPAPSVPVPPTH